MKKNKLEKDDLRPEYSLRDLGPGVTGKYFRQAAAANLVLLDPDVARAFPDDESVNRALRLLMDIAATGRPAAPRKRASPGKPLQAGAAAKATVPSKGAVSRKKAAGRRS